MKKYVKPVLEVVELRVEERITVCSPQYNGPNANANPKNCILLQGAS
jgi:hypothetical protein